MSNSGGVSTGCHSLMVSRALRGDPLWRRDTRRGYLEGESSAAGVEVRGVEEEKGEEEVLLRGGPAARTSVAMELFSLLRTSFSRTGTVASESWLTTFICGALNNYLNTEADADKQIGR